jgi:14-3-3 protein epsilon
MSTEEHIFMARVAE